MSNFIARSSNANHPCQTYEEHISGVRKIAVGLARKKSKRLPKQVRKALVETVELASEFHDFAKLEETNQKALKENNLKHLPYPHWRDGAKWLLKTSPDAAALVYSHHSRLDFSEMRQELAQHVLQDFSKQHKEALSNTKFKSSITGEPIPRTEDLQLVRMGLSCLVNGDWDDSAKAKGNVIPKCSDTRWEERLKKLESVVNEKTLLKTELIDNLGEFQNKEFQKERHRLRQALWNRSGKVGLKNNIAVLSATVGMGKTFSFLRLALRKAIKKKSPHIFIVAPFNHIVSQLVEVVRECLVLDGENEEDIVANHTCTADYNSYEMQTKASRWRCPIIITSAVQFLETLSTNSASKLVKLIEIPNSVVIFDEWHNIMEESLFGYYWNDMSKISKNFGVDFILSSGSMTRFWHKDFGGKYVSSDNGLKIREVVSKRFMKDSIASEIGRVTYKYIGELGPVDLENHVLSGEGKGRKTIVLMSTTKNVAIMAKRLRKKGRNVYCVYGSLLAEDSSRNIEKIKGDDSDWIVICTTAIESGIDINAEIAFSVDRSIASQIQLGGRINREGTFINCVVYIFNEITSFKIGCFNSNDSFSEPARISRPLLGIINEAEKASHSYLLNFHLKPNIPLRKAVDSMSFPDICKEAKIIKEGRSSVLVGPNAKAIYDKLIEKSKGLPVNISMKEISQNTIPCPTISQFGFGFKEDEFLTVPGFEFDKENPTSESSNFSLLYYKGSYDDQYLGIWNDKESIL